MKKIAIALFASLLLATNPALAASGTVGYTPGSGTNFQVTTTGGNDIGNQVLVDPTTPTQQLGITTNSAAKTEGVGTAGTPAGGVASVQGASGGTPLPAALNAAPSIANGNGVVPTQSGIALSAGNPSFAALSIGGVLDSATNGIYANVLQGNAALSATNGVFANILQGNAALTTGNPIFVQATAGSATIGKINTLGNAGGIIDFAGQNASSPANAWLIGGQFQTTPTTITPGNASPLQMDNAGNLLVNIKAGAGSGGTALGDNAAWTAGTTNFTPAGCEFTTGGATAITTAHAATVGCTSRREQFADIEAVGGTASFSNYGTAPGTVPAIPVNGFITNTVAISASALPLPTGASTSANQTTEIASLATIATNTGAAIPAGTNVIGGVTIASGGVASGALASGSIASGAAVSGALVDITNLSGALSATAPTKAAYVGGLASTSDQTAATNGQMVGLEVTPNGKQIVQPWALTPNLVDGGGSSTGTGTFTILAASGSASLKEYLTGLQCGRSDAGTTAITVAITEGTKTRTFVVPDNGGGGGNNIQLTTPIVFAANTAVTAAFSAGVTTGYCNAEGFYAP